MGLFEVGQVVVAVCWAYLYCELVHGGIVPFLTYLRQLCQEASKSIVPHDGSRRRRLCKSTLSVHKYPVVSVRRVVDDSLEEEHSQPYLIPIRDGGSFMVRDPNRWLEDENSWRSLAWIEAQRELTSQYLGNLLPKATQTAFLEKIRAASRFQEIASIFQCGANFFFFSRWKSGGDQGQGGGQQQPQKQFVLYVTDDLSVEGSVLLDPNVATDAGDCGFYIRGTWPSSDGAWLVYGFSESVSDPWMTLRVRNVDTRRDTADAASGAPSRRHSHDHRHTRCHNRCCL